MGRRRQRDPGAVPPFLPPDITASVESRSSRPALERLKIACLAEGIRVSPAVIAELGGVEALTVHEYATTGGLCFELEDEVFFNAPFDDWYVDSARACFEHGADGFVVLFEGGEFPVRRVLPLPGYLGVLDADRCPVTDVAMSHLDRVRLSPIGGCAYDCGFCDLPNARYRRRDSDQVLAALEVALADDTLEARHVLISGGSPGRRDQAWFRDLCLAVIGASPLPVDVMMSARPDGPAFVDELVDAGVAGFSFNIELFGEDASNLYIRQKHRFARPHFDETVARAVERLGRTGAVRSLIIPGLEPVDSTVAGIDHLASLGCDPVISPFRPARDTELVRHAPTPVEVLHEVLEAGREIVAQHSVALGPRCAPCQHNVLAFPWDLRSVADAGTGPETRLLARW